MPPSKDQPTGAAPASPRRQAKLMAEMAVEKARTSTKADAGQAALFARLAISKALEHSRQRPDRIDVGPKQCSDAFRRLYIQTLLANEARRRSRGTDR